MAKKQVVDYQQCAQLEQCMRQRCPNFGGWQNDYRAGRARYVACGFMITHMVADCPHREVTGDELSKTE